MIAVGHNNQKALWGLIVGLVGLPLSFCCFVGFIPGVIALILGIAAYQEIARSNQTQQGNGMAIAAIVLGITDIVIPVVLIVLFIAIGSHSYSPFFNTPAP
ncbi:MAG TPA: DUF4190 domain-containing protein [Candidatus Solibacter sp.]|jgi:hypothetical protein|nr:DUF4190 domain-containing protein [Candidatus Solibacter sp.]